MCGLVGIIDPAAPAAALTATAQRMAASIAHRGPDGEGALSPTPGLALGHVRLAIIDLSAQGAQPMQSLSGRSVIVFNGEIYNFRELRASLQKAGVAFATRSDTEVLLNAYEHWGEDFVSRLNGMFAFALFDRADNTLLIARDRLGIKPLYYADDGARLAFGSEIKAVLAARPGAAAIDTEALAEYLAFQNTFGERTLVAGVKLFPPASVARVRLDAPVVRPRAFWRAQTSAVSLAEAGERRERLADIIREVVDSQVDADVPVNAFLSGGIDSGALASTAAARRGRIMTFTCGFDLGGVTEAERAFDERAAAESVARHIGSEHYEVVLKDADFMARMDQWAWAAEEPRVGSTFPNFCVAGLAGRFTKVCLSGTGGDELFGGYPWRYGAANEASEAQFLSRYFGFWNRMLCSEDRAALMAPIARSVSFDPFESFSGRMRECLAAAASSDNPRGDAMLLFEMQTFLHGLLVAEDKASMAHALEVRVPLVDNRLIDFALSLPFSDKVSGGPAGVSTTYGKGAAEMPAFDNGKRILRDALAPSVPAAIAGARKQGFSPPFETWFRAAMAPWIEGEVLGPRAPLADLLDLKVARRLWAEHKGGRANHRLFVWGLVALHQFCKVFLGSRDCNEK